MEKRQKVFHCVENRVGWGRAAAGGRRGKVVAGGGGARYAAAMNTETGMAMTTFPNAEVAATVLDGLLEARLAACVQTMPIRSAYRWKGAVVREDEVLALIKTKASLYPEVEAFLKAAHPYETPEIVWLPIAAGSADYLRWIAGETK